MTEVTTLIEIARAMEMDLDMMEFPLALSELLDDKETLALAADMEIVLGIFAKNGREKRTFFSDLLMVMNRAAAEDDDQIEAVRDWLNSWLEG